MGKIAWYLIPLLQAVPAALALSPSHQHSELAGTPPFEALREEITKMIRRVALALLAVGILLFALARLLLRAEAVAEASFTDGALWIYSLYILLALLSLGGFYLAVRSESDKGATAAPQEGPHEQLPIASAASGFFEGFREGMASSHYQRQAPPPQLPPTAVL